MVLTKTWLNGDDSDAQMIADISNTLCGHKFVHLPRESRNGRGDAVILQKGFGTKNKKSNYRVHCYGVPGYYC